MDIGGWLRSLGLGEYEAVFRENKIDETVLPKLTADDLKELGVRALGDRRKLLDAIAGLDAYAHPRLAAVVTASTDALPRDTAERRFDVLGPRRFNSTLGAYGPGKVTEDPTGG
jgi:hypothetical protein